MLVLVGDLVAVGVDELGQPLLLRDVDDAVDDLEAHRLLEAAGDPLRRHLARAGVAAGVAQDPDLAGASAGCRCRPRCEMTRRPSGSQSMPVTCGWKPVGPQVGQRVAGVHAGQRQAVAGRVAGALALLAARARSPARRRRRCSAPSWARVTNDGRAGRLPLQGDLLAAAALEVVDAQRVVAGGQGDGAVLGRRRRAARRGR